ncbi:MAG: collagen binding domain-containing protein [Candidatus Bathyarchaeia archaeon]
MSRLSRLMTTSVLTVFLAVSFLPSRCFAVNYSYTYELLDHPDGSTRYRLTVSVTSSLYDYYQSEDHEVYSYSDLAKFVTPATLLPIADSLWSIYSDDEDFANGVLMIVHQIPYEESVPQKYPVETIVENEGDCDLLSFIAASVMKAGGLDVVLLYYEAKSHMNVGVNLSHEPQDARSAPYYLDYDGKRYYVAETTGGNWENGWRVGECPDSLKRASVRVITLEKSQQSSPERVSSSYGVLLPSSISLTLSSTTVILENSVLISGSISPAHPNQNVTIYLSSDGSSWKALTIVETDSKGHYSYVWTPQSAGTHYVRASWSGDVDHLGADSDVCGLTVVPMAESVTFRVEDAAGNALENAEVVLEGVDGTVLTLYTDGGGNIYLDKIPHGTYSVTVYWHGVKVSSESLNVTSGYTHTISCSVYDLTVEVKNVLDIGIRGARVTVYRKDGESVAQATTEATGKVTFTQLPKDRYRIEVLCIGATRSRTISLTHSTTETFLGLWDLTMYAMTVGIGIVIVIVIAVSPRKD